MFCFIFTHIVVIKMPLKCILSVTVHVNVWCLAPHPFVGTFTLMLYLSFYEDRTRKRSMCAITVQIISVMRTHCFRAQTCRAQTHGKELSREQTCSPNLPLWDQSRSAHARALKNQTWSRSSPCAPGQRSREEPRSCWDVTTIAKISGSALLW